VTGKPASVPAHPRRYMKRALLRLRRAVARASARRHVRHGALRITAKTVRPRPGATAVRRRAD
jgi:hypothetical protein